MAWNWGNAGGGALSGAGIGASFGGPLAPVTAAVGGVLGGLIGGLSGSDAPPEYHDPMEGERRAAIDEQLHSHVGADTAAATGGQIRNEATREYQTFSQNPNFAGNANVQSAAYNKIQRTAEGSMVDANLHGAAQDLAARRDALGLSQREGEFDYGTYRDRLNFMNQPSALQGILAKGAGAFAGKLTAMDWGGGDSSGGGGDSSGGGSGSVNSAAIGDALGLKQ